MLFHKGGDGHLLKFVSTLYTMLSKCAEYILHMLFCFAFLILFKHSEDRSSVFSTYLCLFYLFQSSSRHLVNFCIHDLLVFIMANDFLEVRCLMAVVMREILACQISSLPLLRNVIFCPL